MKSTLILPIVLLLASLSALRSANAHDELSPHQRVILESTSPPPIDATFSFDAPAGPQFSDVEKEAQRERGKGVLPMVMKAFDSGAGEVRIPPGDYRFGQERYAGAKVIYPLGFENMLRDAEHPFVIDARFCVPLYDLQAGIRKLRYKDITPSTEGRYWINMRSNSDCRQTAAGTAYISKRQRPIMNAAISLPLLLSSLRTFSLAVPAAPLPATAVAAPAMVDGGTAYPVDFAYTVAIAREPGVTRRAPSDVIKFNDHYYLWYSKVTKGPAITDYPSGYAADIWYANSPDGHKWTEQGLAIGKGNAGTWDERGVFTPKILRFGDKFYLYYTGVAASHQQTPPTPTHIGVAVACRGTGREIK